MFARRIAFSAMFAATSLGAGSSTILPSQDWKCDRAPLVVTNARLWNDGKPLTQHEMIVVDGQIRAIGRAGTLTRPKDARTIDAGGSWLLPGLIDSHVHFGRASLLTAGLLPARAPPSWAVTGRQTLAAGVTTVRIHYSDFERGPRWSAESASDCSPFPTVLLGAGGLLGGPPAGNGWLPQVADQQEARAEVRKNAVAGATWIELHDTHKFAPDVLAAILDEADKANIRLMSGADNTEEAKAAIDAGILVIDHFDGVAEAAGASPLIGKLERARGYVIAPVGFFSRYNAYRSNPALVDRDAWVAQRLDSAAVGAALVEHTRRRFERPPETEQPLVDRHADRLAKFRRLLRSRLALVVGSDAGSQGHFHGDAIWWELRAWRDNGAPLAKLLAASTSVPATMLGQPSRGRLAKGARGDFIIYRGDLAAGELDVAKVSTVAKGGVVYVDGGRWVGPVEPGTTL